MTIATDRAAMQRLFAATNACCAAYERGNQPDAFQFVEFAEAAAAIIDLAETQIRDHFAAEYDEVAEYVEREAAIERRGDAEMRSDFEASR